jgi:hypothetical protein
MPRYGPPLRARAGHAGASAAAGAGAGLIMLARLLSAAITVIFLLIVVAILLRDFGANPHNGLVRDLHDAGHFFARPFDGLFTFHHHPKRAITINWGIAALVYAVIGGVIVGFFESAGISGVIAARRSTRPV